MNTMREFVEELVGQEWAKTEFGRAWLGDRRLDKRVIAIATALAGHPGTPIPEACGTKAKTNGAYNFIENDSIRPEAILRGHRWATVERLKREPVILAPSDTTSFNFTNLPETQGLSGIGPKAPSGERGLWLHSTLAFTPEGLPLGLIAAQFWDRPLVKTDTRDRHQKPLEERESARWRQSWEACQAARVQLPTSTLLVNIDDMEGDIYEVFAAALAQPAPRAELLIRSRHDRKLEQDPRQQLWDVLACQPLAGLHQVRVPRHQKQKARLATLQIRFCEVLVKAPTRKADQPPLRLWAVEARDVHPPKGAEPILWRLLTTLPVISAAAAVEKVNWYSRRWGIEVFHKIIKSVCAVEDYQMQTALRLERAITLKLVVAWRIQVLTQVGRQSPGLPASDYFAESEWKALHSYLNPDHPLTTQAPRLGQMMQWIGQLGGFVKGKSNPHPGSITLARGLARLSDMTAMWDIQNQIHANAG